MFVSGLIMVSRNRCVSSPDRPTSVLLNSFTVRYLAWPALLLSINSAVNQHPLRTKEGGNSPLSTLVYVSNSLCHANPMLYPLSQSRCLCSPCFVLPHVHGLASWKADPGSFAYNPLINAAALSHHSHHSLCALVAPRSVFSPQLLVISGSPANAVPPTNDTDCGVLHICELHMARTSRQGTTLEISSLVSWVPFNARGCTQIDRQHSRRVRRKRRQRVQIQTAFFSYASRFSSLTPWTTFRKHAEL